MLFGQPKRGNRIFIGKESPIDTWSENEYELNKTYAFDTVNFSEWLTELRKAILEDTLKKIDEG